MSDVRILNSWKEISQYIGRGLRTVQRWEELYGLPVHRAARKEHGAVYALTDEIDAWLRLGRLHEAPPPKRQLSPEASERYDQLMSRARTLVERLRILRQNSKELRAQLASRAENQNSASRRSAAIGSQPDPEPKVRRRA